MAEHHREDAAGRSAVKELLLAVGANVDWQTVDAHALVNESAPIWQSKREVSI